MTQSEIRELAEKHWKYTEGLLAQTKEPSTPREHYLYVEAMIHGFKHGENAI
jgi:hypothetical protein